MLSSQEIQCAADRIAAALKPEKIILFGSYARGDADDDSDLDLMVIAPRSTNSEFEAMIHGRKAVGRVGVGVDILVYDKSTFEHRKEWCSSPVHWAHAEGKVLYKRPTG